MVVFEREVRVAAPLPEVWAFHSTSDGLVALTPDWMHLRVEETRGPDGDPNPEVLGEGAVVISTARPFGVGPRQRWVSEIVERRFDEDEGTAVFRDVMRDGPFPKWEHTHRFRADGDDATIVHDRVEYELPGGPFGRAVGPVGFLGMEPVFRYRHQRTKELLEG
ncbi:SRPBCC family protein [Haloarcula nitratireducens]|uniref:SRPBCC family protein n=1 Tax=Haloarcula nitratireducens TaxID=2487749 RepID=A0AAW4P805_9EURY|nr:SRPBCC family protein [Halomicroarcula nitratireducens]MBX0293728.1 SRPBCC family protein [Halomicroarcula nitratireducens]